MSIANALVLVLLLSHCKEATKPDIASSSGAGDACARRVQADERFALSESAFEEENPSRELAWEGARAEDLASDRDGGMIVVHDGSVWAWGYNGFGQLADEVVAPPAAPVPVAELREVPVADISDSRIARKDVAVQAQENNAVGLPVRWRSARRLAAVRMSGFADRAANGMGVPALSALRLEAGTTGQDALADFGAMRETTSLKTAAGHLYTQGWVNLLATHGNDSV